ncbi:MAG: hypothetical protein DIU71_05430 [Proteobacteria bacterium]|nr:MAG: hypothetical protein DIU71_05430 [Pseudomonadota bacterium]
MPLRISFDLEDADLRHFETLARETQDAARARSAAQIVAAARQVLERAERAQLAQFMRERFAGLRLMLEMLADDGWQLGEGDRQRVINALACFAEAPRGDVPALQLLEHAIMIELVSRDLQHDVAAYADFCRFRERHRAQRRPGTSEQAHAQTLENKRLALQARMHERRLRDLDRAGGAVRRLFALFRL